MMAAPISQQMEKPGQNSTAGTFSLQGQIRNFDQDVPEFSVRCEWASFPTLPIARILICTQSD